MEHAAGLTGARAPTTRREQLAGGIAFDWIMVILSALFLAGLHIDGWAHTHGKVDQSFFTPWHALFYASFLAVAGALGGAITGNRRRGYTWFQAVPAGYELAVRGAAIFAAGGLFDLVWHTLFGIENGAEALISPSHLVLVLGMFLVLIAPFRAAWQRTGPTRPEGLVARLPMLLSLTFTVSLLAFMTQFAHPFVDPWASQQALARRGSDVLGISAILLQTAILMGLILVAMRRWPLPFGSMTLIFSLSALFITLVYDQTRLIPAALVAGLIVDLLARWLRPSPARARSFRLFAFTTPAVLYVVYFLTLLLSGGLGWSIHFWTGAVVLAGIVGLMLSYLVLPPPIPDEAGVGTDE